MLRPVLGTLWLLLIIAMPGAVAATNTSTLTAITTAPARTGTVPPGSQGVPFLGLTLTNSSTADISVSSLTVSHRGLGDSQDLLGIYVLTSSRERLSSRAEFTNKHTATVRLRPALIVKPGEKIGLSLVADISPQAAVTGEHQLAIASATDIDANGATVTLQSSPMRTGTVSTSGQTQPSIQVEYPTLTQPVYYGRERTVGRLRLQARGQRLQAITAITLTSTGKARGKDLQNIVLTTNRGQVLTTPVSLNGPNNDKATLVFATPYILKNNASVTFSIRADVLASRRQTIQLIVQEAGDIESAIQGR